MALCNQVFDWYLKNTKLDYLIKNNRYSIVLVSCLLTCQFVVLVMLILQTSLIITAAIEQVPPVFIFEIRWLTIEGIVISTGLLLTVWSFICILYAGVRSALRRSKDASTHKPVH